MDSQVKPAKSSEAPRPPRSRICQMRFEPWKDAGQAREKKTWHESGMMRIAGVVSAKVCIPHGQPRPRQREAADSSRIVRTG